ncbi:MAG: DEAD/DEAH box helicase [Methanosarcinales archaeon]
MTLNPIRFAHDVNQQFLRYQLTAFPMSDPDLADQAKKMLSGSDRESPLVKGPYLSLSRSFQEGKSLQQMVKEEVIHPAVAGVAEYPILFAHQQETLEAVKRNKSVLVTTGTGSGKTEAFLYPILDYCFKLRDSNEPPGIVAVVVYPMNALAIDQLGRLRRMLAGTGITFGMYIGNTPRDWNNVANVERMQEGEDKEKIPEYIQRYSEHKSITIIPYEERHTKKEINEEPPRILLTNANQLELLVTRASDQGMFQNAPLRFLVFDEAHTYSGATGAEVATLIRRLRAFCNKTRKEVICIGTSATITDTEHGEREGIKFASRFFGVIPQDIALVHERYVQEKWSRNLIKPDPVGEGADTLFSETLEALKDDTSHERISSIVQSLSGQVIDTSTPWQESLYGALKVNQVVKTTFEVLNEPLHLKTAVKLIWQKLGRRPSTTQNDESELLSYLVLGAAAEKKRNPLLRPKLHYFVRGLGGAAVVLYKGKKETSAELFFSHEKALKNHKEIQPTGVFSVMVCTNCGQHFFETWVDGLNSGEPGLTGGFAEEDNVYWTVIDESDKDRIVFTNRFVSEIEEDDNQSEKLDKKRQEAYICPYCGSFHQYPANICSNPDCKRSTALLKVYILTNTKNGRATICPGCGQKGRDNGSRYFEPFRPLSAVIVADIHILAQDMINAETVSQRKLITFADNRQDAAFQAAWMEDHARRYRLRQLMYSFIEGNAEPLSIGDLQQELLEYLKSSELARTLIPEVYAGETEEAYSSKININLKKFLRIYILRELVTGFRRRDSLETWGVVCVDYYGLNESDDTVKELSVKYGLAQKTLVCGIETLLDHYRRTRFLYDETEPIFSHYWHYGDFEVQQGYLPFMDFPPKGLNKEMNGMLEEMDERLLRRCREYLKTLARKDLNTYTLSVLARDGFLPGYGTYEGNITAFAGTAFSTKWQKMAFELTRAPTIAVREFIPGNLIYANGGKYRTVLLHLPFSEERITPDEYILDVECQKIVEKGVPTSGYSGDEQSVTVMGLPICDIDIGFISHVSDEESNRYKLPVYIAGYLQSFNRGGISYTSGENEFDHLIGQAIRLVNVGPSNRVIDEKYGYPICIVCGGTRSPYASEKEIEDFKKYHLKSCGKEPGWYAITSDATVDGILLKNLTSYADAVNLAEALRIGANQTLEMNPEDLQILILPQGAEEWDIFLYDHMVGGSGLLNQLIGRWQEIIKAADALLKCPNSCEKSCYVCMRSFYNMHYHDHLDRKRAIDLLLEYDHSPQKQHDILPKNREERPSGQSTNLGESRLRQILLDHGFPPFDAQEMISIPHSKYKTTTPDLLRVDQVTGAKVAIYLDGLSKGIHGNQERQQIDSIIRTILRNQGYHVEEISTTTLDDPELLRFHLKSIANALKIKFD